jgi:CDP-diacylglycerol---serine O-phosphatidyltransferase
MGDKKIKLLYILPNLFTAASIFLAVLSIIAASNGEFEKAGWFIILGTIFDALDGRVARMTNTTSKFGAELDSLADVVSFGMAPAFLLYFAYGSNYGKFGILVMALYVIFGAIRLARFNIVDTSDEPNVFIGLPIPAAAIFVVSWIIVFQKYDFFDAYEFFLVVFTLLAAILMVSNIRYPSFKKMDLKRGQFVKILIVLIIALSLMFIYPIESLCLVISLYIVYGIVRVIYTLASRKTKASNE